VSTAGQNHFLSIFLEGLLLRLPLASVTDRPFPCFFVGTFIEAGRDIVGGIATGIISLPFWKGFH